ncbi:MAG: hypothetical protein BRD43_03275 [Bacteroidetes bacterium QS_4_64_154]|nr:MAG: hypothetical protein BRD43_03275 [Bacteroidetes bacterium QS_4_64_154]
MLRTCLADGYIAETQWAKYTNNAQTSPVAGAEPREVMPLVSYRASAEVVLYEIHEVGGRRQSAEQVLNASSSEGGSAASDRRGDAGKVRGNESVGAWGA